jgi:DNA-binding MarR family transcriptional regulator
MRSASELAESIVGRFLALVRYRHSIGHWLQQEYHISGKQATVLRFLVRNGPQSVSAISRHLYTSDGATSPLLERMAQAGYVTRTRCAEDNRKVLVEPTPLGRELTERVPLGVTSRMRTYLPNLPIEQLESIDSALSTLLDLAHIEEPKEVNAV